jgi:hypothetical protein
LTKFIGFLPASLLTLLLISGVTFSQPVSTVQEAYSSEQVGPELNEGIAYLWLLGATAVPMLTGTYMMKASNAGLNGLGAFVFMAGLFAGPSAGQFYAGSGLHGAGGIGLRIIGVAATLAGIALLLSDFGCSDCGRSQRDESQGSVLLLLGAVTFGAGNLYSIIDTHFVVKNYNQAIIGKRAGFLPTLKLSPEGQFAGGGRVWMSF